MWSGLAKMFRSNSPSALPRDIPGKPRSIIARYNFPELELIERMRIPIIEIPVKGSILDFRVTSSSSKLLFQNDIFKIRVFQVTKVKRLYNVVNKSMLPFKVDLASCEIELAIADEKYNRENWYNWTKLRFSRSVCDLFAAAPMCDRNEPVPEVSRVV